MGFHSYNTVRLGYYTIPIPILLPGISALMRRLQAHGISKSRNRNQWLRRTRPHICTSCLTLYRHWARHRRSLISITPRKSSKSGAAAPKDLEVLVVSHQHSPAARVDLVFCCFLSVSLCQPWRQSRGCAWLRGPRALVAK